MERKISVSTAVKRFALILPILLMLLSACTPASPSITATQMMDNIVTPAPTSTFSQSPTFKPSSTILSSTPSPVPSKTPTRHITPTISLTPSATISPAADTLFTPHPLALNEYRAGMQMKQLARIGTGQVNDIEYSPDGKYLAVATGLGVFLYDALTLEQVGLIDVNDHVTVIAFNPDGTQLALARDTRISTWDVETGKLLREMEGENAGGVWTIVYGKGGYIAAYGQKYQRSEPYPKFMLWQASTGRLLFSEENLYNKIDLWGISIVDISPDGRYIAFVNSDGFVLRDIHTAKILLLLTEDYSDVIFSPDGTRLFTSDEDGAVWMIDLASSKISQIFESDSCWHLSRNGNMTLCYKSSEVVLFDPTSGKALKTWNLKFNYGEGAAINPDGRFLARLDEDSVIVMDTQSDRDIKSFYYDPFEQVAVGIINLDGINYYVAATGNNEGQILIWDLATGNILRRFQADETTIAGLVFSPDQRTLASLDKQSILRLWDIPDELQTFTFNLHKNIKSIDDGSLEYSPDGLRLAMIRMESSRYTVLELDIQTQIVKQMPGNISGYVYSFPSFFYLPNGHLLTSDFLKGYIQIIDLTKDEILQKIPYQPERNVDEEPDLEAAALSSDARFLVIGFVGNPILIWDLNSNKLIHTLVGHETLVDYGAFTFLSLIFNPQNHLLVSVGVDHTTRLWNILSGSMIQTLDTCCYADFSPDGRILVTAGNGVMQVWGVPPWP